MILSDQESVRPDAGFQLPRAFQSEGSFLPGLAFRRKDRQQSGGRGPPVLKRSGAEWELVARDPAG